MYARLRFLAMYGSITRPMNSIEQAKNLLEAGNIKQGRMLLEDITNFDPDNVSAWLLLCGISTRTQDWELGAHCFKHLTHLRPSSSLASSGLVQSYMNLNRCNEVLEEIKRFQAVANLDNEEVRIVMKEHQRVMELITRKAQ